MTESTDVPYSTLPFAMQQMSTRLRIVRCCICWCMRTQTSFLTSTAILINDFQTLPFGSTENSFSICAGCISEAMRTHVGYTINRNPRTQSMDRATKACNCMIFAAQVDGCVWVNTKCKYSRQNTRCNADFSRSETSKFL